MSSVKTGNTGHKKLHPGTVILGENGMPVDAIATISGTYVLLNGVGVLSYSVGTVTTPIGTDLTDILNAMPRYTGKYILITNDGSMWFIDRQSINTVARTFKIYTNDTNVSSPAVIDLTAGWSIAEVEIVNRLATTSMAKIDQVEFRDMQFQFSIDGDNVGVQGSNGNTLEPNPDGSVNVVGEINLDTSVELPSILNVTLTIADTDYPVVIPASIKRYSLKVRNGSSRLKLAFTPINSNPYLTIERGTTYTEDFIKRTTALTIYLQSNKDNQVLELIYWT